MCPTFKPGKNGQASSRVPSIRREVPGGIGEKGVLVNTPTFTWVYTRKLKKGKEEIHNLIDCSSFCGQDAVFLNKKKWVTKILTETTSQEKLKMRKWVNFNF